MVRCLRIFLFLLVLHSVAARLMLSGITILLRRSLRLLCFAGGGRGVLVSANSIRFTRVALPGTFGRRLVLRMLGLQFSGCQCEAMAISPTGLTWRYPLGSPTPRFTAINNFVRGLDVRFNAFDSHQKSAWARYSSIWPRSVFCLPGIFDEEPPPEFRRWAIAAYRNVNTTNLISGVGVADEPPKAATPVDGDVIGFGGSDPYSVTWTGRTSAPVPQYPDGSDAPEVGYVALFMFLGLNHPPEKGPAIPKFHSLGVLPITYGVTMTIGPFLGKMNGAENCAWLATGVAVSDFMGVPFFGNRGGFPRGG